MGDDYRELLSETAERALSYIETSADRSVFPTPEAIEALGQLGGELPQRGEPAAEVLERLDRFGSPATVATTGGRYFGFVVGGALPATIAAHWLADTWDQNASQYVVSPTGAYLEEVALGWLRELLGLPDESGGAFVTGAQMANFTCLAAARHAVLERVGWNVERDGLFGAPAITVVLSEEAHVTVRQALALLGLGRERVLAVPTDEQGRMRPDQIPETEGPTILCAQVGNVNTGASDPVGAIRDSIGDQGVWLHVDGAFGLWAAASPEKRHLAAGVERADSWAVDAHKWLNVPHDSAIAMVRNPDSLTAAMAMTATYFSPSERRDPMQWTPEASRRARGVEIWTALRTLGRDGVANLIERTCAHARTAADGLRSEGFEILNDVTLNQVLVSFGSPDRTHPVIEAIQAEGTCWCGATVWKGRTAMRLSVSSWRTTSEDIERSIGAIARIASAIGREEA